MKFILGICLCLFSFFVQAQVNLVPNPSFEEYKYCPILLEVSALKYWFNPQPRTSPDYFNTCATNPTASVPVNHAGFQWPVSGFAYAGIAIGSVADSAFFSNYREYIEVELVEELHFNQEYKIQFWVSVAEDFKFRSMNIGVSLSNTIVLDTCDSGLECIIDNVQFLENRDFNSINDTINWIPIKFLYTAKGGEKFLTIGNFLYSANSTFVNSNSSTASQNFAYLYIDDVEVSRVNKNSISFNNPVIDNLIINFAWENSPYTIYVYDSLGKIIFPAIHSELETISIPFSQLPAAIYFILIRYDNLSTPELFKVIKL